MKSQLMPVHWNHELGSFGAQERMQSSLYANFLTHVYPKIFELWHELTGATVALKSLFAFKCHFAFLLKNIYPQVDQDFLN